MERSWEAPGTQHPGVRHPRARRQGQWSPLTDGLIIAFAGLLVLIAVWSAWSASPVGPVRRWVTWESRAVPLTIEYPAGWRAGHFVRGDVLYVMLTRSQWVRVHLIIDPAIVRAGWGRAGPTDADVYRSLGLLHESLRGVWTDLFGPMNEGRAQGTVLGQRRAVWSQFTYTDGLFEGPGQEMAGYRATLVGAREGVLVAAVAPAEDWSDFRPIALRILRSLRLD